MTQVDDPDRKMIRQFQNSAGEPRKEAFSELYRRHEGNLRRYLTRVTRDPDEARDLTQEAFRRALKELDGFQGKSKFKTWLYRIATYTWRDKLRKSRPSTGIREDEKMHEERPVDRVKQKEREEQVNQAVRELPEKWRAPLILVRYEDMKYREAAYALDLSTDAVRMRVHRAHKALKEKLKDS